MKNAQNHLTVRGFKSTPVCVGWLLLLFIFIATPMDAAAQTVHALLVVMDTDAAFGTAMKANQTQVEQLLATVEDARELRVEMQTRLRSQNEATVAEIKAWLEETRPAQDDVLFVYFSGYGSTEGEVSVFLQDGELRQTELAQHVRDAGTCRLKLLVIDACRAELRLFEHETPQINAADVTTLFRDAEGFVHLTSATPPEFGWVDEQAGGIFTYALMHALTGGLTSWTDVFDAAKKGTADLFQRAYPALPAAVKASLRRKNIENQTPKAYAVPHQRGRQDKSKTSLWHFTNRESRLVSIETVKAGYQLKDLITFDVEVKADVNFILLNWDTMGDFNLIFPNGFQNDTWMWAGTHPFPDPRGDFELELTDRPGTEKFKALAFRNATDSEAIVAFFPEEEEGFRATRGKLGREVEEKILVYLQDMNPDDWAEAHLAVELREAKRSKSRLTPRKETHNREVKPEGDIYYVKDGSYMYLIQVKDIPDGDPGTVNVYIFNEELREKLNETFSQELVLGKRVEPEQGWGKKRVMLSFYRDRKWHFTPNAVVFEDYYLLPEEIDGKRVQGPREVEFADVRIPHHYDSQD